MTGCSVVLVIRNVLRDSFLVRLKDCCTNLRITLVLYLYNYYNINDNVSSDGSCMCHVAKLTLEAFGDIIIICDQENY
jgi:hypothetical protein